MNHVQVDLREPTGFHIVNDGADGQRQSDIADDTTGADTVGNAESDFESLTLDQTAKILGTTVEKVKLLVDNNILCRGESLNGAPTLIAACVQAQAGKSKSTFMQEVKSLIAGETNKRLRVPAPAPSSGDMSIQELFDDIASVDLDVSARMIAELQAKVQSSAIFDRPAVEKETQKEKELVVEGIDRKEITAKNLDSLLENLDFTNIRLEGAMYRVGYLEAKIEVLEEQLDEMPELRAKFARSLILENENAGYKKEIDQYQTEKLEHLKESARYQSENAEYLKSIARQETELLEMHSLLDRIRNSWWCRLWCWMTGNGLK